MGPRLEQDGGLPENKTNTLAPQSISPPGKVPSHGWVDQGVQIIQRAGIGKHHMGQRHPIEPSIRHQNAITKSAPDRLEKVIIPVIERFRSGIRIVHGMPQRTEDARHDGLAGPHASGETDDPQAMHAVHIRRTSCRKRHGAIFGSFRRTVANSHHGSPHRPFLARR